MTEGTKGTAATLVGQVREQFSWLPRVLLVAAVLVLAWGWWALAFLASTRSSLTGNTEVWPPHLPVLLAQFSLAVFGPVGASIVVMVVLRRAGLALLSVLLGYGAALWFTLRGAAPGLVAADPTERKIMLVTVGLAAILGLALGVVATRGPQRLGFVGVLALAPVTSLLVTLLHLGDAGTWLGRVLVAALLVLIAWRRWTGVLLWPLFVLWFWLVEVAQQALRYGTETLRHRGGHGVSLQMVLDAMTDFLRNAWEVLASNAWSFLWPAILLAAVALAWRRVWPGVMDRAAGLPLPARKPAPGQGEPASGGD
ncbi:MAG: hypothetical protein ACXVGM_20000 [Oryzihumus sp.]